MDCEFKHDLGERVKLVSSGEQGIVTACAVWDTGARMYYIHYVKANGCACDDWFDGRRIESV